MGILTSKNGHAAPEELELSDSLEFQDVALEDFDLTKEELKTAGLFDRMNASSMVGLYENIQKLRMSSTNKISAHNRRTDVLFGLGMMTKLKGGLHHVEKQAARFLAAYAKSKPLGQWCMKIAGVGPVVTAGLLSHVDFHTCCCQEYRGMKRDKIPKHDCKGLLTAGALHKFAGMIDPRLLEWKKGQKRPYNARLKRLCWIIGESFKKLVPSEANRLKTDEELAESIMEAAREGGLKLSKKQLKEKIAKKRERAQERMEDLGEERFLYARLYMDYKRREVEKNERGEFKEQALERLEKAKKGNWTISPEQRAAWESGKLQPIGIDLRAKRRAVCIFLSHFHQVGREIIFGDVVKPWVIVHGGHQDYIPPPFWEMKK